MINKPAWCRPSESLNVWKIVERKERLLDHTERTVRFSIQEVPKHRQDEIIDHMIQYFLADEAIRKSINAKDDEQIIQDQKMLWEYCLSQGIVQAAYKINSHGRISELVGANMILIITKETEEDLKKIFQEYQSSKLREIMKAILGTANKVNIYKMFGVDKYMSAFGLSISAKYRGHKLGLDMLETRTEVGRKYGIRASATIFTAEPSQALAERVGYQVVAYEEYSNIFDDRGKPLLPNIESKVLKYMAKQLY